MSGNAQPGQHPDADSLNAFAEQVLEAQEREQIVTHLAMCSRCREIVFLAQQSNAEMEPAAAGAAMRAVKREPWFRSWRLAWVPVGALAAGITVAYVVHARHANTAIEMAQMANEVREASPPSVEPAPVTPVAKPEQSTEAVAKKSTLARKPEKAAIRPEAEVSVSHTNEPVNALAGLKAGPKMQELSRQRTMPEPVGAIHAVPQDKTGLLNADKGERQQFHVTVTAAPMMQAEAASLQSASAAAANRSELPGGLVAVSTATLQRNVLAVDRDGAVFLSTDTGAHWNPVERQWTGKAVEVRAQMEVKAKADTATGESLRQSVFELVNDQGQVWESKDGQSWKAR